MNSAPVSYSNRLVFNYLSATNRRFDEPRKKLSWQRPSPTRNVDTQKALEGMLLSILSFVKYYREKK